MVGNGHDPAITEVKDQVQGHRSMAYYHRPLDLTLPDDIDANVAGDFSTSPSIAATPNISPFYLMAAVLGRSLLTELSGPTAATAEVVSRAGDVEGKRL